MALLFLSPKADLESPMFATKYFSFVIKTTFAVQPADADIFMPFRFIEFFGPSFLSGPLNDFSFAYPASLWIF